MRSLDTLIRVHQMRLDERRRALAELDRLRASLRAEQDRLEAEIAAEQETARSDAAAAFAYGAYARAAIERRARLAASLDDVSVRIEAAEAAVREAFEELKRHEIARASRARRARAEAERRDQIRLDEMAIDMHRRRPGRDSDP